MPELPEIESLKRLLARSAVGRTIVDARVSQPHLRRPMAAGFRTAVVGRRIEAVSRRAKYLLVKLSGDSVMMVHLGMSGSLTHRRNGFDASPFDPRHDHVRLRLDDGSVLVYNDPRRFGLIKVATRAQIDASEELKALGPEPLNSGFDARYLKEKARSRKVAIKNFLMDQRIVAGIGNIYASEILFHAGVRPTRRAGGLKREEIKRIVAATPAVLREAIGNRGTTFRSYRDSRGRPGRFASRLCVYGREGERCYVCGASIRKIKVGQRSSFFCPGCQH